MNIDSKDIDDVSRVFYSLVKSADVLKLWDIDEDKREILRQASSLLNRTALKECLKEILAQCATTSTLRGFLTKILCGEFSRRFWSQALKIIRESPSEDIAKLKLDLLLQACDLPELLALQKSVKPTNGINQNFLFHIKQKLEAYIRFKTKNPKSKRDRDELII
jgi:hypothetical protein